MYLKTIFATVLIIGCSCLASAQEISVTWSKPFALKSSVSMYQTNPVACAGENEKSLFIISTKDPETYESVLQRIDKVTLEVEHQVVFGWGEVFVKDKTVDIITGAIDEKQQNVTYSLKRYNHSLELLETSEIINYPYITCLPTGKKHTDLTPYLEKHNIPRGEWGNVPSGMLKFTYDASTRTHCGQSICMSVLLDENYKLLQKIDHTIDEGIVLSNTLVNKDRSVVCYGAGGVKSNGVFTAFPVNVPKGMKVVSSKAIPGNDRNTIAVVTLTGKDYMEPTLILFRTYSVNGVLLADATIPITKDAMALYKGDHKQAKLFYINANTDGTYGVWYAHYSDWPGSPGSRSVMFSTPVFIKLSSAGELLSHTRSGYKYMSSESFNAIPYIAHNGDQTIIIRNELGSVRSSVPETASVYFADNTTGKLASQKEFTLPDRSTVATSYTSRINEKSFLLVALRGKMCQIAYLTIP